MGSVPGMVHRLHRRSGQAIGIDFAIGLTIFLATVSLGFIYTNSLAVPSSPFSDNVQQSAMDGIDEFRELNQWTVYRMPVTIDTAHSEQQYPLEVLYSYPGDVDPDSTLLIQDGGEIRSQTDLGLNDTIFYANLTGSKETFDIIYTRSTNLDGRNYTKDVFRTGDEIYNGNINYTVDSNGIADLRYGNQQLIADSTITDGSTTINHTVGVTRATTTFNDSGTKYLRAFGADNRLRLRQEDGPSPSTYSIDLQDRFDEVYVANYSGDSRTEDINESGTVYSGEADIADFHDTGGTTYSLGLMHEDMDITIENNSGDIAANVTIASSDARTLFLPHTGDETAIASEIDLYFDQPTVRVLPVERERGLSARQVRSFSQASSGVLSDTLGLSGLGFNITVEGVATMGQEAPGSQQVAVIEQPASILGRFANTTLTDLRVSVWL